MAHTFTTTVAAPRHEVFAWHSQPGAIRRLMPPWLPMRVLRESPSLRDGSAVISMLGIPWVAEHDRADYDPPRQFSDELVTAGLSRLLRWRHVHSFESAGSGTTKVVDRVDAPVPRRAVESFFRYRHEQLAADLWAHRQARAWSEKPMTVAVTGASGTIGTALTALLSTGGHRVIRLVRRSPASPDERRWQPADPDPELMALYPFCRRSGPANILIMPALHTAHISSSVLRQLGGGTVIGPILLRGGTTNARSTTPGVPFSSKSHSALQNHPWSSKSLQACM